MTRTDVRRYAVQARSTDLFGRVLCSARNHHFVVDGPAQNGCPGEELLPPEIFLGGVAACGVELLHVIARERGAPLAAAVCAIEGEVDRARPVRPDVTVFNRVRMEFQLRGVTEEQAQQLVEAFRAR